MVCAEREVASVTKRILKSNVFFMVVMVIWCCSMTLRQERREKINSLVFIMLCFILMVVCFCKYTHFLMATEKKIVGMRKKS